MLLPIANRLKRAVRSMVGRARGFAAQRSLDRFVPLRSLPACDTWDPKTILAYQLGQLNELVHSARRETTGYAEKYAASHVPEKLADLAELASLPFLTKEDLRKTPDRFSSSRTPPWRRGTITSGGTTGTPTRFAIDEAFYNPLFTAHRHYMWSRAGYRPGARCLDLTASFATAPGELREYGDGNHYLSITDLEPAAKPQWLPHVQALDPEFIIGFPSTASALGRLIGPGMFPRLKALLLASEVLLPGQRQELLEIFGARVFTWYGMSELAGFACGCEKADTYHFLPSAGIVEIVGDDGRVKHTPGESGEIVLTGFLNRATPFVRYRTGDRGTIGDRCPHCRRDHMIVAEIEGRTQDYLVSARGRRVPLSALNFHTDEFRRVLAHQFVEEVPGQVTLRLVALGGFGELDRQAITSTVTAKLGPDFHLTVVLTPTIERSPRGKIAVIVRRAAAPIQSSPSLS